MNKPLNITKVKETIWDACKLGVSMGWYLLIIMGCILLIVGLISCILLLFKLDPEAFLYIYDIWTPIVFILLTGLRVILYSLIFLLGVYLLWCVINLFKKVKEKQIERHKEFRKEFIKDIIKEIKRKKK